MNPPRPLIAVLMAALLLAGCSVLAPHLERPHLEVVGVEVERAQWLEQRFRVRIRVDNPNNRSLPVRRLDFSIELAGDTIGGGASATPFTVAPLASTEFEAVVTTDLATTLLKIVPRIKDGSEPVPYRLVGTVTTELALLGTVPFDERGTFSLNQHVP